jgi:FixJ family two-component response regulator
MLDDHQAVARRLVGTLDATELQILHCLVRGMSEKGAAALTGVRLDELRRFTSSMMKKLKATRTADAVRIGLYAALDLPN